jgi:hypothetical protein
LIHGKSVFVVLPAYNADRTLETAMPAHEEAAAGARS